MTVWKFCGHPKTAENIYQGRCRTCRQATVRNGKRKRVARRAGELAEQFRAVLDARAMADRLEHMEELRAMAGRLGGKVA